MSNRVMKRGRHQFVTIIYVINSFICAAPPWLCRQFKKCRNWHYKPALKDSAFKLSLGSTSLVNQASITMAIGSSSAEASPDVPSLFEDQMFYPEMNDYQVETQGSHDQVINDAAIEPAQIDHDETVNPDVEVLAPPPPPKGRKKRSKAWDCFTAIRYPDGKEWVVCDACNKKYARSTKKETSNMLQHLKKCPGRRNEGDDKPADTGCIKFPVLSNKKIAADQEWNQLIQARRIIENGHPWSMVQQNTLKADILRVYEGEKKELHRSLGNLSSRLNLTMNLLKHESHDRKTIYCYLTLHFINDNWELWKKILSFKKLVSWENHWDLFVAFRDMLLDWKIGKNICALTVQNTEEYDQIIADVKRWLAYENALPLRGKLLHVGCFAHILDLLVEDGFKEAKDVLDKMMECISYVNCTRDNYDRFQIVVQCLRSEGKEVTFEDIPKTWTFSIQLLEKVLSLREAFNQLKFVDDDFSLNPLPEEWDEAYTICNCLKVIDEAVQWFSRRRGLTTNLLFPQACNLYKTLCDWNKSSNPKVVFMSSKMKMKFDVYWRNNNLVLAIAIVLDPRFKFDIVERWYKEIYSEDPQKHCERIHDTLKEVYCVYASSCNDSTSSASFSFSGDASSSKTYDTGKMLNPLGMPHTYSDDADDGKSQKSELERYLEEPKYPPVKEFDILGWWRVNTFNFPTLAKFARDFLAIPMLAACSNPTFSADIMKIDLVSMDPEIIEALICAKDWLQMPEKNVLEQGFT